jgi:hypothetical protein
MKNKRYNSIVAYCIISESELAKVIPDFSCKLEEDEPQRFTEILYDLGIDITKPIERQDGLMHRNRLNEVVVCSRYIGYERLDDIWITSGYASQEAKDKASGSRLLEDLYRAKMLTEDAQDKLEARDRYKVIDESVQG